MTAGELFKQEIRLRWTRTALLKLGLAWLLVLLLDAGFTELFVRTGVYNFLGNARTTAAEARGWEAPYWLMSLSHLGASPVVLSRQPNFMPVPPGLSPPMALRSHALRTRVWFMGLVHPLLRFFMPGVLSLAFLGAGWRMAERLEQGTGPRQLWWGMGSAAAFPFLLVMLADLLYQTVSFGLSLWTAPSYWADPSYWPGELTALVTSPVSWATDALFCVAIGAMAHRRDVALILSYGWVFLLAPLLPSFSLGTTPVSSGLSHLQGAVNFLLINGRLVFLAGVALGCCSLS